MTNIDVKPGLYLSTCDISAVYGPGTGRYNLRKEKLILKGTPVFLLAATYLGGSFIYYNFLHEEQRHTVVFSRNVPVRSFLTPLNWEETT